MLFYRVGGWAVVLSLGQWVYVPPAGRHGNVVRALFVAEQEFYQVVLAPVRKRDAEFVIVRPGEVEAV